MIWLSLKARTTFFILFSTNLGKNWINILLIASFGTTATFYRFGKPEKWNLCLKISPKSGSLIQIPFKYPFQFRSKSFILKTDKNHLKILMVNLFLWLNTQYNSKMCFSTHLLEEKKITKLTSRYYNFLNKATFEEIFNLFRLKFFFYLFVFFCLWKCLWWRSNPVVNFFSNEFGLWRNV